LEQAGQCLQWFKWFLIMGCLVGRLEFYSWRNYVKYSNRPLAHDVIPPEIACLPVSRVAYSPV